MKKVLSLTLLTLALALVSLMFGAGTPAAQAAPPTAASGSFAPLGDPTNVALQFAGPNIIVTWTRTNVLSGTFSGTVVSEQRTVVRADGSFTGTEVSTFTGTVDGVAGTDTSVGVFAGDNATSFHGHFVIVSGTGGLANLHGQGTTEGSSSTGAGTYSGQILFSP